MRIQLINYSGTLKEENIDNIEVNTLHAPRALDDYDINIIDLRDENLWANGGNSKSEIISNKDLHTLHEMLKNARDTDILFILPQNVMFKYDWTSVRYRNWCELKDMLPQLKGILQILIKDFPSISYSNTKTIVDNQEVPAAFYFPDNSPTVTKSERSGYTTTTFNSMTYFTTLDIPDNLLIPYLRQIGLIKEKVDTPEWMENVQMFDDKKQLEIIQENQDIIQQSEDNIETAKGVLSKNDEYKSVLYTTGDELVNVVLKILQEMLGCDFTDFEDKKKEDFLTVVDEHIFIGEIKGVNHNVKSQNISQLDVHYQGYLEENPEVDHYKVQALLIMNHQKTKHPQDREEVHEQQIDLAKRNGSLIVSTYTLLKLFEKYLNGEKSREECIEILASHKGILEL